MSGGRRHISFVLLLLGISCGGYAQTVYSVDFARTELSAAIRTLEREYGLLFSYEESLIAEQTVHLRLRTEDVDELLRAVFRDTAIRFERVDGNYVLLLPRRAPDLVAAPPVRSLCGRVIDGLSRQPLAYANVYLAAARRGTAAGAEGRFCLDVPASGDDTLVISYVGYREYRVPVAAFSAGTDAEIALGYLDFGRNLVIVTEYLGDGVQLADGGFATEIAPRRLCNPPGQAAPDVLRSIRNLPGVSSPDGAPANLYIRGSTPDQNLILWEDIPIYHAAHYFGTISAFSPYVTDRIRVYRGGFGAEYGGRIGGVIDLRSDPRERSDRFGVGTDLGSVFLDGTAQFPRERGALSASVRRSVTELGYAPFFRQLRFRNQQSLLRGNFSPNQLPPGLSVTDTFSFFDAQLKYALDLSPRDRWEVAYLHADNDYGNLLSDDRRGRDHRDRLRVRNRGWSSRWERRWSAAWSTTLIVTSTAYDYDYRFTVDLRNPELPDGSGDRSNDLNERGLRLQTSHRLANKAEIIGGYHLTDYAVKFVVNENDQATNLARQAGDGAARLHVLFADYQTAATRKTGIKAGLRVNRFGRDRRLLWEPRVRFWHALGEQLRFQAAAGRYYQFISQLNEFKGANIGISSPLWILADEQAPVINAWHAQGGMLYEAGGWLIDLQAYARESRGLSGLAIGFLPRPSQGFDLGRSHVRGLDLMTRKRWGDYSAWLSYSLSRVRYVFPTFFDPEFAAPFDQRHRFYLAGNYRRQRWDFSLSWRIGSGLPYSLLERFELLPPQQPGGPAVTRPIYDAYHSERLVPQHQLDVAVVYTLRAPAAPKWNGTLGLSLLNVYDRTNVYLREYYVEQRPGQPPMIDFEDSVQLGFTPNLVLRLEFF